MVRRANNVAERPKAAAECRHHWVIDSATGPTSKGICKYCGSEREFLNWCESFFWEDDVSTLNEPRRAQSASFDRRDD